MNFYNSEIIKLTKKLYPRADLNQRIIEAKKFIDIHYADNLDIDQICMEAAFSKYHFIRQFKKLYGCTAYQYLTEVRIVKARELIRQGMTVRGTCFSVGFDSVNSFSSLFKKITGKPPSEFKVEKSNFG